MDLVAEREELRQIILNLSYRKGNFTLTSGLTSDFYINLKKTALDGKGGLLIGKSFCRLITETCNGSPRAVAGITLGADPLVSVTSLAAYLIGWDLPGIIIRKEPKSHGTGRQLEIAGTVSEGTDIVLLDDVLTTGGTLLKVGVPALEREGFRVVEILTVIDRQENDARKKVEEAGYKFASLFTKEELIG